MIFSNQQCLRTKQTSIPPFKHRELQSEFLGFRSQVKFYRNFCLTNEVRVPWTWGHSLVLSPGKNGNRIQEILQGNKAGNQQNQLTGYFGSLLLIFLIIYNPVLWDNSSAFLKILGYSKKILNLDFCYLLIMVGWIRKTIIFTAWGQIGRRRKLRKL